MKRIVLVLMMIAFAAMVQAQSQPKTIKGKTRDGKNVVIKYYPGTIEDNIESVKYQVVDELEARVKSLQSDTQDLQNRLNTANKQVKQLQKQLESNGNKDNGEAIQKVLAEKQEEIVSLTHQVDSLNIQMSQLYDDKAILLSQLDSVRTTVQANPTRQAQPEKASAPTPIIGIEINGGIAIYGHTANENWETKPFNLAKQFSVYYGTPRLSQSFPISLEVGVGINNFAMSAHHDAFTKTHENQTDLDHHQHTANYTYSELDEHLSLTYLGIPIRVCFGQPTRNKVSVYAKLGITPSFRIGNRFEGTGIYTLTGYYPQWDVTLSDNIMELGFVNDAQCYADNFQPSTKPFVLWGNVALGACVPLGKSPIQLNFGIKADYTFTPIGNTAYIEALPDGMGLLYNGNKVFIPSATFGIIYTIK